MNNILKCFNLKYNLTFFSNQVGLIKIRNFFFKGYLAETDSSKKHTSAD